MIKVKTFVGSVILCICVFSFSNCSRKNQNVQLVENFYNQLNHSNYPELSEFIGDSVTMIEGDYTMNYSKNEYYKFFQWDSVFSPTYKLLEIRAIDTKTLEVKVSKTCTRIEFLNQSPIVSKELIEIEGQKISKIKNIEMDADFTPWNRKKTSIITWIKKNHPQLDGFMYDQTKTGAQNYLKAIALYKEFNKEN